MKNDCTFCVMSQDKTGTCIYKNNKRISLITCVGCLSYLRIVPKEKINEIQLIQSKINQKITLILAVVSIFISLSLSFIKFLEFILGNFADN